MDILNENATVPYSGTAVALGDFDGLHIAHTAIIKNGIEYARQNGLKSGVLLFNEKWLTPVDPYETLDIPAFSLKASQMSPISLRYSLSLEKV